MRSPNDSVSLGAPDQSRAPTHWVTRDVRLIFVAQVVFGFGWSLYLLIPKYLATELHAGPEVIGRISAMGGFAGLLTVPFAAGGMDRYARSRFFQLGALLIVGLSIGFSQVHSVGPLVYVLQGCVSAAFVLAFNSTAALLSDYAPPERFGQAIGWLGGANVGMNAVATIVAEPLAASHGWRAVFGLGVLAGVAAFGLSFGLRAAPPKPRAPAATSGGPVHAAGAVPLLISVLLMGATFIAMFGFVQPYAVQQGASQVRGFFVGYTAAVVAGRVLLGGLGDRLGRRKVSIWMLIAYGAAAFIMARLDVELLVAYGIAFGAAHGIVYPTLNALLFEHLPDTRRGLGMVLYNGAFNLGSSVGAFGWGILAHHHGYPAIYGAAAASALCGAALLAVGKRTSN
ncbi:MAG TPA: MFS transporter [Polyangiales bacterium]|nr:MFS transporter [Polyangiales bacterium]